MQVYGRPISALPANVSPEHPALVAPPREVGARGIGEVEIVLACALGTACRERRKNRKGFAKEEHRALRSDIGDKVEMFYTQHGGRNRRNVPSFF